MGDKEKAMACVMKECREQLKTMENKDRNFKITIYAAGSGKKLSLFVKPSRLVRILAELSVYYDEFEIE